jgi:hypothetical protein
MTAKILKGDRLKMSTPTKQQIGFARGMSSRQWATLHALSQFSYYLSASERADPEVYALIKNGLAYCHPSVPGDQTLVIWTTTPVGSTLMKRRLENRI